MDKRLFVIVWPIAIICLLTASPAAGRAAFDRTVSKYPSDNVTAQGPPAYCTVSQNVGKISLAVSNNGTLGDGWAAGGGIDCFTGLNAPSCEYPKNSNSRYLFAAAFWIAAIVGGDTTVSTGADGWSCDGNEFRPDESPFGDMVSKSIRFPENPDLFDGAISEQDFIATYSDTFPYIDALPTWLGLQHRPLNIEVTQRSYAWSYSYAEDFILFDYEIKNIGHQILEDAYMGFYNDSDVGFDANDDHPQDDICGFRESFVTTYKNTCDFVDTVNLAWIADNDGDPESGVYTENSVPHVTAMRIIRTPGTDLNVSFNWWVSNDVANRDFGPREREGVGQWPEEFRDFGTGGLGTPEGDRNKYYLLRNQEFDYDQIFTSIISATDTLWTYPSQEVAATLARGFDTRYLLSFGPFDIEPGQSLPITFAYVAGENFHRDAENYNNLENGNPRAFYDGLDFSDLAVNSMWASRVYDNPGNDPDGDDVPNGEYRVCCFDEERNQCDTIWHKGDGIPDFQGASPPPAPDFRLEPRVGAVRVVFNGLATETTPDVFSRLIDFEGYRVYVGRDERAASYSMVASFDIEDYNKFVFNPDRFPEPGYELFDVPFTTDSLKVLYGNSFDPLDFPRGRPFTIPGFPDSICYFEPQDFNCSQLGKTTPIRKVYPDQPYPSSLDPLECNPDELTNDGYVKYFQYEIVIDSLLPTVEWWINVTAFDYGSPESGLEALETAPSVGARPFYPLDAHNEVVANDLKVFVYPNPYRSDGGYRDAGFEGRTDTDRPDTRVRELHFANLPPKCTIRIYSLDGDLIRELGHDVDPADPTSTHDTWDLITRNTQMIVSGLYFWTVEAPDGETQIGKFVVIM